jgi:predicted transglutaminase-like cysteine proteinase
MMMMLMMMMLMMMMMMVMVMVTTTTTMMMMNHIFTSSGFDSADQSDPKMCQTAKDSLWIGAVCWC